MSSVSCLDADKQMVPQNTLCSITHRRGLHPGTRQSPLPSPPVEGRPPTPRKINTPQPHGTYPPLGVPRLHSEVVKPSRGRKGRPGQRISKDNVDKGARDGEQTDGWNVRSRGGEARGGGVSKWRSGSPLGRHRRCSPPSQRPNVISSLWELPKILAVFPGNLGCCLAKEGARMTPAR